MDRTENIFKEYANSQITIGPINTIYILQYHIKKILNNSKNIPFIINSTIYYFNKI